MDLAQQVDWTGPARWQALRRAHLTWLLRRSGASLAAVLALVLIGLWWVIRENTWWFLIGAVLCAALIAWRVQTYLSGLHRAALAAGPTVYRLSESGLRVQNALGSWTVGWAQIERVEAADDLLLVTYAGRSLLSVPAGELANSLRARWQVAGRTG